MQSRIVGFTLFGWLAVGLAAAFVLLRQHRALEGMQPPIDN